jgi:cytochrome c5
MLDTNSQQRQNLQLDHNVALANAANALPIPIKVPLLRKSANSCFSAHCDSLTRSRPSQRTPNCCVITRAESTNYARDGDSTFHDSCRTCHLPSVQIQNCNLLHKKRQSEERRGKGLNRDANEHTAGNAPNMEPKKPHMKPPKKFRSQQNSETVESSKSFDQRLTLRVTTDAPEGSKRRASTKYLPQIAAMPAALRTVAGSLFNLARLECDHWKSTRSLPSRRLPFERSGAKGELQHGMGPYSIIGSHHET